MFLHVSKVAIGKMYLAHPIRMKLCLMLTRHLIVVLADVCQNKLFYQYCCALYGSQRWSMWHESVNKMCMQWRNALVKV